MAYTVESTDPYSTHPESTDEVRRCETVDDAAAAFAELTGWTEDDARDALAEGDITHTDQESGRQTSCHRGPSSAARLYVRREAAKAMLEVAEAHVLRSRALPPAEQFAAVTARDDAQALAEEMGVFEVVA